MWQAAGSRRRQAFGWILSTSKYVQVYASGACYEGEWARGERHGRGAMTWAGARARYVGGWQRGLQHGRGEHVWLAPAPAPPGSGAAGNPFLLMHNRCSAATGMLKPFLWLRQSQTQVDCR